ncbi:MAG: purine-nucleoside phosphorylase [Actinomycetota bacterium]
MSAPQAPVTGVIERATGRNGWKAAVVLGSGLSSLAGSLVGREAIPYSEIEEMPTSGVVGHEGALYAGEVGSTPTLVFAGRVHLYEGREMTEVTYPVRAAIGAGCDVIVLTNAAGGIDPTMEVGAPCLISDHLNLTGRTPLFGPNDDSLGPRFLDQTEAYDSSLRQLAREVDPSLREGVYAGLLGPTYETPAEVKMLRTLGADLVGMSTVNECIAARYLGARVLGISVVSNLAAGISEKPLSHDEVSEAGRRAAARLERLLRGVLEEL